MKEYRITRWDGESRTLFYVLSLENNEHELLNSFESRQAAENFIRSQDPPCLRIVEKRVRALQRLRIELPASMDDEEIIRLARNGGLSPIGPEELIYLDDLDSETWTVVTPEVS